MVTQIQNLPSNTVGFRASGEVTQDDFTNIIIPRVKELVEATGRLNYLLVLDNGAKGWTVGAWMKDAMLGLKNLIHWNRAAIVTDSEGIRKFTDVFSVFVPGEFKGFENQDDAVEWVSEEKEEKVKH